MTQRPAYYHHIGRGNYRGRGRGRGRGSSRGFGGGSVTNTKIICYICKAECYKRYECPELTKTSDSTEAEHQSKSNPNPGPSQR